MTGHIHCHPPQVDFSIVRPCAGCERGAIASKPFAPGDVVATVPFHSSIELGSGSSAEQAYRLLEVVTLNATLRDGFNIFLGVLPGHDDVLLPEVYSDEEMRLLQTPGLVSFFAASAFPLVPARWTGIRPSLWSSRGSQAKSPSNLQHTAY